MKSGTRKCLVTCCIVTTVVILLLIVAVVVLYFTILKPKRPEVVATPVSLRHIEVGVFPILQLSIGIDVFIKNRNYAGFKYGNTSTSLYYRGEFVGWVPIPAGEIRARATENISTVVDLQVDKVVANPGFWPDVVSGMLNLTSSSTVVGDVILVKIFKLHATSSVNCDITVFVWGRTSSSNCVSTIKV